MIQKISLFLLVFCLAIAFLGVASAHANSALVSVDSVDAQPGEQVAIPVRLSNFSDSMYAYAVFLQVDETWLSFDSISFVGSVAEGRAITQSHYYEDSGAFRIVTFPEIDTNSVILEMYPANGVLATVYFHISQIAPSGYIPIDSTNLQACFGCQTESINIAGRLISQYPNPVNETIYPDFKPGGINVKIPTGINDGNPNVPDEFSLNQNYPNPFNPTTVIEFSLPTADNVKLNVYNILGQEIDVLASGRMTAGRHQVIFSGDHHPSGIYFYRLQSTSGTQTRKMILTK